MSEDREQRIRERAHRIWEEEGRPEGREDEHWRRAEREIDAANAGDVLPAPDDAQARGGAGAPADPLRNPEPVPPATDPMYPAITGPEEVPDIPGARGSLNPSEIVEEPSRPKRGRSGTGTRRKEGRDVPLRERPGKSIAEP